ncbi:MAG: iron ABC transporter permease [Gammaproteobacteria bacterium]|nr:MAG: iron ABC transporter permease [Gammaproteobacteria bacterium]
MRSRSNERAIIGRVGNIHADAVAAPTIHRAPSPLEPGVSADERKAWRRAGFWTAAPTLVALIVGLPILAVFWLALNPSDNIWPHLVSTVLGHYITTTLLLMLGVAIGTVGIGVSTAWLVTHHEFPGRRILSWALLLPFAVPAYVIAYLYTDFLEFAGPVQSTLREIFGWQLARDYWFPDIRTLPGAIIVMTLVMYPYVYILARAAFLEQSASTLEAAQALGASQWQSFLRVALPMARPSIAIGLAMVMMETINDFGTVDYFAVRTLSLGLYDTWLGMNNLGGAAQIASLMLLIVALLVGLERLGRRGQRQHQASGSRFRAFERLPLAGRARLGATLWCVLPVLLGFAVPAFLLTRLSIQYFAESWTPDFREAALHSLLLAAITVLCTLVIGILLAYSRRLAGSRWLDATVAISCLGYAVPGAVLAVGVIIPFAAVDNRLSDLAEHWFGVSTGLLLSGTVFALVFAYTVRFLTVAHGAVDASMKKISPNMDDAARSLGHDAGSILRRIHLPLVQGGVLTAAIVVFVDCMKELPATLLLRPFNFDTLATHVYQYASDELLGQASLGALLIVAAGLLPVILLSLSIDRSRALARESVSDSDRDSTPQACRCAHAWPTHLQPSTGKLHRNLGRSEPQ